MNRHTRSLIVLMVQLTSVIACAGVIWLVSYQSVFSHAFSPQKGISENRYTASNSLRGASEANHQKPTEWQAHLTQLAEGWITEVTQDEQFHEWKDREVKIIPYAPGSKQWLVLLEPATKQLKRTGYLLIACADYDSCTLVEYGWLSEEKAEFLSQHTQPLNLVLYDLFWLEEQGEFKLHDFWSGDRYEHIPAEAWKQVLANHTSEQNKAKQLTSLTAWHNMNYFNDPFLFIPFAPQQQVQLFEEAVSKKALADFASSETFFLTYHPPFDVNTYYSVTAIHSWENAIDKSATFFFGVLELDGSVRYIQYNKTKYLLYQL